MKLTFVIALLFLTAPYPGCGKSPPPPPPPTPTPTPVWSPTATPTPRPSATPWPRVTLQANPVPERPVGFAIQADENTAALINAAQADHADITVIGNGEIRTGIIIEAGHTVTLARDSKLTSHTSDIPVMVKQGGTIQGSGWTSVITESDVAGQWNIIASYNGAVRNGDEDRNITIRDLKIEGFPGKSFNSAPPAVAMGNCVGCLFENVWVDGTHSIGVNYGGAAFFEHLAQNSIARHFLLTRIASQAIACVNCVRVTFTDFYVLRPGLKDGPGATSVDLETNGNDDVLTDNIISNFVVDHRDSEVPTTGNGIVIQAGTTGARVANNIVQDGIVIGGQNGNETEVTNTLSNALYSIATTGTVFRRIKVSRTGQSCVKLDSAVDAIVEDISCEDVGGGGTLGLSAHVSGDSRLNRILFSYTGRGPADNRAEIFGNPNTDGMVGWELKKQ